MRDSDKAEMVDVARKFYESGFSLYATGGTAKAIFDAGMDVTTVPKLRKVLACLSFWKAAELIMLSLPLRKAASLPVTA